VKITGGSIYFLSGRIFNFSSGLAEKFCKELATRLVLIFLDFICSRLLDLEVDAKNPNFAPPHRSQIVPHGSIPKKKTLREKRTKNKEAVEQ
jgi:hypothetical protein